jgi:hypothetical protein
VRGARGSLLLSFLVAAAAGSSLLLTRLHFDHDTRSLLRGDPEADEQEGLLARAFGSEDLLLLAWPAGDLLEPAAFERLRAVTREVEAIPGLEDVYSAASDRVPFPLETIRPIAPGDLESPDGRDRVRRAMRASPAYVGTFYSRGLDVAAVASAVRAGPMVERERAVRAARAVAARHSRPGSEIVVAGVTALAMDANEYALADLKRIGLLALVAAAVVLFLLCRDGRSSVAALAATGMTPMIALGLASLLRVPLNAMGAALFPVLAVVGITTSVHLIHLYEEHRRRGLDAPDAAWVAARKLALPILLSLGTTAAGFLSLGAGGVPAFRDGGRIVSLGLLAAAPVTLLGLPAALSLLAPPPRRPSRRSGRLLLAIGSLVGRRPLPFLAAGLFLTAGGALLATRARVHIDVLQAFQPSSRVARTYRFLDERLTATLPVDVLLRPRPDATTEEIVRDLRRFRSESLAIPGVEGALGLVDLLDQASSFLGGKPSPEGAALPALLALLRTVYREQTRRFESDSEPRLYRVKLRVREGSDPATLARIGEAAGRIRSGEASLTGLFVRAAHTAGGLRRSLLGSAALLTLLVTATVGISLRSFRAFLASLLPNVLPLAAVFGGAALAGMPLDVSAAAVASVAAGVTVDSTLYFVFRAREERKRRPLRALLRAERATGRAIVFSNAILVAGLGLLSLSSFLPTARFGLLTAAACGVGVLGALLLLPAGLRALRAL